MGDGGHVLDHRHFKTGGLERADGRFASRTGALDKNFHGLQAVLHSSAGSRFSGGLRGKRGALAAAPEAHAAGGGPGNGVALGVGDSHHGVVEGRADMHLALLDIFPLSAAGTDFLALLCGSHSISFPPLLLFVRDGALRTLAGTGVGFAALAAHGETLAVAQAAVRTDLGQVLDVQSHLAAKIAQETFARALGAVDRFDGRGDVRAWLFTIARNVWVDHCRRHRRETELPGEDLPGGGDFAGALEDREEVLALHRILHTLPEPYKEVFGLRVFGELSFRAIGQVFGKTEGWARVTYYRAKSRILRQWEAERDESEL